MYYNCFDNNHVVSIESFFDYRQSLEIAIVRQNIFLELLLICNVFTSFFSFSIRPRAEYSIELEKTACFVLEVVENYMIAGLCDFSAIFRVTFA